MAPRKPKQTAEDRRLASEHLITRLARRDCRCGKPVLRGHVWGEPTTIDLTRINRAGEMWALLQGWKTFQQPKPGGAVFRRRGFHISQEWPRYAYVHAEHRCGTVWAARHYDLREIFPSHRGDRCPY